MATVGKSHYICRRATLSDVSDIQEILSSSNSTKCFSSSQLTLETILELHILCIIIIDQNTNKIVGFASATDQLQDVDTDATVEAVQAVVADTIVSVSI